MKVNFSDFTRDEQETKVDGRTLEKEIDDCILGVRRKKDYILGSLVEDFERAYANYCGTKYCISVGNGLSALALTLRGAGVKQGDEVITAANTFNATVSAIHQVGARPVLVDADPSNFNMDISQVVSKLSSKTKAVIPVHLYGQMVEMNRLFAILNNQGIPIIEDACQAHGAIYQHERAGSFGLAGCFSFYPGKNLGAAGDGGAVTTNDESLANFLRKARNYGQTKKYYHDEHPDNSRLDTIQAAVLIPKLKVLDQWTSKRIKAAQEYRENLQEVKGIEIPSERSQWEHVYHLFVIKSEKRDELKNFLEEKGIQTGVHYPIPIHFQDCFSYLGHKETDFPVTEKIAEEILTLPMFPTIRPEEIKYVTDSIKEFSIK